LDVLNGRFSLIARCAVKGATSGDTIILIFVPPLLFSFLFVLADVTDRYYNTYFLCWFLKIIGTKNVGLFLCRPS
jgi:hypothetical protein